MSDLASTEQDNTTATTASQQPKKLPKGVVLGPDGKPCRSCTSFASWAALTKSQTSIPNTTASPTSSTSTLTSSIPRDCPPDVEQLGRSTWTLLHTLTATYPESAPPTLQAKTTSFLSLFSELYPCWVCAEDFQKWMKQPGNQPKVKGRDEFGRWMCEAHNNVNRRLGKEVFDCAGWEGRWRTGVGKGAGEGCS